jgi:hypothetical protein
MLTSTHAVHGSSSSSVGCSEQGPYPIHLLDHLILHLLPGRIPGLTQQELLPRIQRALPHCPGLTMTEVRPPVLSSVLARLRHQKQIGAAGEGPLRCYWRLVPDPLTGEQAVSPPAGQGTVPPPASMPSCTQ